MSENTNPHPGSWIGDLGNEWKTAKPPEKVMIVLAIVATVGIALYLHGKSQAPNQPGASGLSGIPANFQQGTPGGGAGGISAPVSNPTQPPTSKPTAPPTTPKKGTPGGPAPNPAPIFKATPIIRQPTTLTKTYASTNHAPSSPYAHLTMKNAPSPSYNRVFQQSIDVNQYRGEQDITARARAQRNDILQLRKEQAAPQRRPLH